jgi:hypothetical protein
MPLRAIRRRYDTPIVIPTGRGSLADAMHLAMRRLRASAIVGAAEVQFLTPGNVEFRADHRVQAVVWLELALTARPRRR